MRSLTTAVLTTLVCICAHAADIPTLITERAARIADLEGQLNGTVAELDFATKRLAEFIAERDEVEGQFTKQGAALSDAQTALVEERRKTTTVRQQAATENATQWKYRADIDAVLNHNLTLSTMLEQILTEIHQGRKASRDAAKPKAGQ